MTLADVKRGDEFIISRISDKKVRAQAIRFGISEGANLSCGDKIPGGPVILKKNFQEIAVGRNLAKNIIIDIKN
ncbi:MAG: FeoA family protein [Halothermotrichaceae bacterium]